MYKYYHSRVIIIHMYIYLSVVILSMCIMCLLYLLAFTQHIINVYHENLFYQK